MRMILVLTLCSIVTSMLKADDTIKAKRLATAQRWLAILCVDSAASITDADKLPLLLAAWSRNDDQSCTPQSTKIEPSKIDLNTFKLVPNIGERLLRSSQFRTEVQQTPDYVYGIDEGSLAPAAYHANPDHGILGYGGPINLQELYINAETRVALCTSVAKAMASKQVEVDKPMVRGVNCDHNYLRAERARDYLTRTVAAMAVDVRGTQVPLFQNGIILAPSSPSRVRWTPTVTGSFDPTKLFRTAAERRAIFTDGLDPVKWQHYVTEICQRKSSSDPINGRFSDRISLGSFTQRVLTSLLPHIDVKVTTPFDLAKYGNTFLEPPNRNGRSVYSGTLTWDLRSIIPSAATRAQALESAVTIAKGRKADDSPKQASIPDERRRRVLIAKLYVELASQPELVTNEEWWLKFRASVMQD